MKRILLVASLALLTACGEPSEPKYQNNNPCGIRSEHYLQAKKSIVSNLTSPSTAKFAGITSVQFTELDNCRYIVTGYVDSQNGFGAMVRSNFKVFTRYSTKGQYVIVDSVNML